jgi:cell wall-associated NlpC family hydrolase
MYIPNCGRAYYAVPAGFSRRPRCVAAVFLLAVFIASSACVPKNAPDDASVSLSRPSASSPTEQDVVAAARKGLGTPYRFGGTSPQTGFDCSGLVLWSYEQVGIPLPRSAREQIGYGIPVQRKEDLKPGDIVVFKGIRSRTGWHSGIYAGDGKFIHSPSNGKVVTESGIEEAYFARRFAGARRIPRDGSEKALYAAYLEKMKGAAAAVSGKKHPARHAGASGHAALNTARRHPGDKHAPAAKNRLVAAKQSAPETKNRQAPKQNVPAAKNRQTPVKRTATTKKHSAGQTDRGGGKASEQARQQSALNAGAVRHRQYFAETFRSLDFF